ncbi:putative bifunctional diguanylate cyclase/phosphodiesterase [Roseomonas haemaphysalidis]|uniref:EAL domain-containing protein n=1 Tax=Roseomonas haemaphysalidis TaxID=2768162 RepID=A0ABS3KMU5_9PROT|nr:EAL domain-containing protein [Roseomonas haemaphysalidis]MBO1078765.1 EAL domain-containing protein [Roseomonas haemaphysalidis]
MPLIAIIDDQSTNRRIYSMLVRSCGPDMEVRDFADPLLALEWMASSRPDLIITDYRMPGMDGADMAQAVRSIPHCLHTPVIVITAYDEPNFRLRALEAGASDFVQTPIRHSDFQGRVRAMLDGQVAPPPPPLPVPEAPRPGLPPAAFPLMQVDGLMQVIGTIPALISVSDLQGVCQFANAAFAKHVGLSAAECVGRPVVELIRDQEGRRVALNRLVMERGEQLPSYEESVADPDGVPLTLLTTKSPLRDAEGAVVAILTTSIDITDQKNAQWHLQHLAGHDALTGLPNRSLLTRRIESSLAQAAQAGEQGALLFLDLDHFKTVNDSLGHVFGDQLLVAVARILRDNVGPRDTVARLGGDEFAILQEGINGPGDAAALAGQIGHALSQPLNLRGHSINISSSIGITMFPQDANGSDELLKNADLAMYGAKAEGRHGHRFFSIEQRRKVEHAQSLDTGLREGLRANEFLLHYQPQFHLGSGRATSVEALIRWQRPGHGLVSPGTFLRAAEDSGFIVQITEWVVRQACAQMRAWMQRGIAPDRVAINVSPTLFRRLDMHRLVTEAARTAGVPLSMLELELTEGVMMDRSAATLETLHALRRDGVSLALDDFGTGFSSLDYLRRFKVNRIKIDQSFVRNLPQNGEDASIVRTIIGLTHGLGLLVVAEGVETQEALDFLRAEGCDEVQGFHLGRPCGPDDCAQNFLVLRRAAG